MSRPSLFLAPAALGWRVAAVTEHGEWSFEECPTPAEAVSAGLALASELRLDQKAPVPVHVGLPVRCAVVERLQLPTVERDEIESMVRLQFEKTLHHPVEEMAFGSQILSQTESETALLACAVHHAAAEAVCRPLLDRHSTPRVTLWAMHLAAQAPADAVACGFWREEGKLVFGIFENRRLGFVEILPEPDDDLRTLFSCVLMRAEMTGAPAGFTTVLLDSALDDLREEIGAFFSVPIRKMLPETAELPAGDATDLTPALWQAETERIQRAGRRRKQFVFAGILYGLLLAAALVYLALQSRRLGVLQQKTAALQPQVDAIIERQSRWKALAPAIDHRCHGIEILYQIWQCLPTAEARITRLELGRSQFVIEGEAPTAKEAIAFAEALKKRTELADYRIESTQPVLLPNEHAQFRVFGKQ